MNRHYSVSEPKDFSPVIKDILDLRNNEESLIITLEGDLGAGKTTFTQELAKHLGLSEQVTSPTFTIMKQYQIEEGEVDRLIHIDAYRIESEDEIEPLHLESVLSRPKTIICIEWPNKISSIIPTNSVKVSISIGDEEVRQVEVSQI